MDKLKVLAAFSPQTPHYCDAAVRVLTQLIQTYGADPVIVRNASDGLSICASVIASQTQTPSPVTMPVATMTTTPTPVYTPRP